MSDQFWREVAVSDPLSEVTRQERKFLLGASALGVVIVKTGLVPSKISALGIEFEQADQKALLIAVGAVVLYFLFAFIIYGTSDFALKLYKQQKAERVRATTGKFKHEGFLNYFLERAWRQDKTANIIAYARIIFEFVLPVLIAIYSIILLWTYTPNS